MEVTGIVFSVIAEARYIAHSISTRIENIRDGPETFSSIVEKINSLTRQLLRVEELLKTMPDIIPDQLTADVRDTVQSVHDTILWCNSTLEKVCSKAFPAKGASSMAKLTSMFRRTTRATSMRETMKHLDPSLQEASAKLLTLIGILATRLNIQKHQNVVVPKLDKLLVSGKGEEVEVYCVGASTPALPLGAKLNFEEKDADGKYSTPEGILKHSILSTESSATVTAAAGVITSAHGVVGMAGVGKTIALQALAFLDDIRIRFPDGIQYICLGQKASLPVVRGEIAKIMRLTGASASVPAVERSPSLREAIDYAVAWFEGKICLFLVDDLWPTEGCQTGFLGDLRQLLRSCSKSRMVISTRSTAIADEAGRIVDFAPRAPLGPVSVSIFMMHATRDARRKAPHEPCGSLRKSVTTILTICAGLPIALAVTGSTVGLLAKEQGDFEGACDAYASQLVKRRSVLGERKFGDRGSLNTGISLSLKVLETSFVELKEEHDVVTKRTISVLYESFCVLRNQGWIPVRVLSRMWMVDFDFGLAVVRLLGGLSLCEFTFREVVDGAAKEAGLQVHDLLLDFCKRNTESKKTYFKWHARLLNVYVKPAQGTFEASLSGEHVPVSEDSLLQHTPRSWWSVIDDGYIHANLARHLISANLGIELAALLLDSRWTYVRAEIGGILSLIADFECLLTLSEDIIPRNVNLDMKSICRAIQLSWGRMSEGKRSFLLQMCGRLLTLRRGKAIVELYLESIEAHTPVPHLLPLNPFFPHPRDAQVLEIPVDAACWAIDCSPCGYFIAAGADNVVVIADAFTGGILKRLEGHSVDVVSLSFVGGSSKILSASEDGKAAIWEWEKSESPINTLKGMGFAVSKNGKKIFSCAVDSILRIWDASTGAQVGEYEQKIDVYCVAASNDGQWLAIGLRGGSFKVINSCTGDTLFEDADAHSDNVLSAAFSANDELLATGSADSTLRVWNTRTWERIGEPFQAHTGGVPSVTFSPVGQELLSGSWDHTARLWDPSTGRNVWTSSVMHSHVSSVAFTPDGERVFTGCADGFVRIWDIHLEAEATELQYGCSTVVLHVAISDNGLLVASAQEDKTVCLWDTCTGNQIDRPMEGHTDWVRSVSFRHDGRQVVSGSIDRTVRVWDTETLTQVGHPLEHTDKVFCAAFSSDGLRILSGSEDKTVRIWDATSELQIGDALEGHVESVWGVSESADGYYVVSKDASRAIIIWCRGERSIVWKSRQQLRNSEDVIPITHVSRIKYEMTDEEAEKTIRSCGERTPYLWPTCFPRYTGEVSCRGNTVYSNIPTEGTLLGTLPSYVYAWKYNERRKLFVAAFAIGTIGMCSVKL